MGSESLYAPVFQAYAKLYLLISFHFYILFKILLELYHKKPYIL